MEAFSQDQIFRTDDPFNSFLDTTYGSEISHGQDAGLAACESLFDGSLSLVLEASAAIGDLYTLKFPRTNCDIHDLGIKDGSVGDAHILEIPTMGGIPDCPGWHQMGSILPSHASSTIEPSPSMPESEFFHSHLLPRKNKSEMEYPTIESSEMDESDLPRRLSHGSTCSGMEPTSHENVAKNNVLQIRSAEDGAFKVRRKRGRKRSNLNPEERRARRLERGRLAANKSRRRKREIAGELETAVSDLLVERDMLQKRNDSLEDQIRELRKEILKHVGSDSSSVTNVTEPVLRGRHATKTFAGERAIKDIAFHGYSSPENPMKAHTKDGMTETGYVMLHETAQRVNGVSGTNGDARNAATRSADEIVGAALGVSGRAL